MLYIKAVKLMDSTQPMKKFKKATGENTPAVDTSKKERKPSVILDDGMLLMQYYISLAKTAVCFATFIVPDSAASRSKYPPGVFLRSSKLVVPKSSVAARFQEIMASHKLSM
jgi:hypothetical protein